MFSGNGNRIEYYASLLDKALNERETIDPITAIDPTIDITDAYAIQMKNVERALARGAVISGKKIGLTSFAMQQMFGVDEPDYGHLFNTMNMSGNNIPSSRLIQPRVEGEIAYILKEDISGPNATVGDVIRATASVVGAIEIVDSRIRDWKIRLIDTVADNASSGMYVLGTQLMPPDILSLPREGMVLYKNGQLAKQGAGVNVMGDPSYCVAWLANKLWEYGVTLKKGEVVLSGALTAAVPAEKGDCFEVIFANLGIVSAVFG